MYHTRKKEKKKAEHNNDKRTKPPTQQHARRTAQPTTLGGSWVVQPPWKGLSPAKFPTGFLKEWEVFEERFYFAQSFERFRRDTGHLDEFGEIEGYIRILSLSFFVSSLYSLSLGLKGSPE